jgi:hypothetical protein
VRIEISIPRVKRIRLISRQSQVGRLPGGPRLLRAHDLLGVASAFMPVFGPLLRTLAATGGFSTRASEAVKRPQVCSGWHNSKLNRNREPAKRQERKQSIRGARSGSLRLPGRHPAPEAASRALPTHSPGFSHGRSTISILAPGRSSHIGEVDRTLGDSHEQVQFGGSIGEQTGMCTARNSRQPQLRCAFCVGSCPSGVTTVATPRGR